MTGAACRFLGEKLSNIASANQGSVMSVRSICVTILLLLALTAAQAAEINVKQLENGSALVTLEGRFDLGDIETFRTKVASLPAGKATVALHSKGGRLLAGIRIGTLIRAKKFATVVPEGAQCASACALAWLGGTRRFVAKDASVGFHAAFIFRAGEPAESGPGNAILGAYLNQLGLSEKAILYITRAAPTAMEWMSMEEAAEHGIAVSPLPAPHSAAKSSTAAIPEHPDGSPERRAMDFVLALAERWSGPNAEVLPSLDGLYTDKVLYYGKPTARETVVVRKRRFADRWTRRTYEIRPGSLSATCAEADGTCRVKGLMNWKFQNADATDSSRGVASFEYSVVLAGKAPQIAAETSSVNQKPPPAPNPLMQVGKNLQQLFAKLRPTTASPAKTAIRPKGAVAR
jgi:hypothetical protein